jgi:hypothetical protein
MLGEYLGVDRVLWLRNGIAGDDTHGHIDDLARFTGPDSIVLVQEDDPGDVNYEPLRENRKIAERMPVRVRTLPMPAPLCFDGQRLPASYANFYIANQMVLVPTFNDAKDRVALNILAEAFPDRRVIGINCVELVWGLGTLHCMTQQQPATGRNGNYRLASSPITSATTFRNSAGEVTSKTRAFSLRAAISSSSSGMGRIAGDGENGRAPGRDRTRLGNSSNGR